MTILKKVEYKKKTITISESKSDKGYQFKCFVGGISLGCLPTLDIAEQEGKFFINKLSTSK